MPTNSVFGSGVMNVTVEGLEEAQRMVQAQQLAASERGGLYGAMAQALGQLHRYAAIIVHVRTGRLKNSLFTEIKAGNNSLRGYVATNVVYAIEEERRGGAHAFFTRTVRDEAPRLNSIFSASLQGGRR